VPRTGSMADPSKPFFVVPLSLPSPDAWIHRLQGAARLEHAGGSIRSFGRRDADCRETGKPITFFSLGLPVGNLLVGCQPRDALSVWP
jgi:hypothetical protein